MHAIAGFSSNRRHCNQAHHSMGFRADGEGDEKPPNHTLAALGVRRALIAVLRPLAHGDSSRRGGGVLPNS